jgi:geranylgeranylglycerol-phosphate geranylgeranyltransferase
MARLSAYLQLARPLNVVIAAGSVLVGALAAGVWAFSPAVLWAMIVAALITAGANAMNDLFDLDIDRINKPHRPLPAGRLSGSQARGFSIVVMVVGLGLSVLLGLWGMIVAWTVTILLVAYSARLKRTPLWGNLAVALAAGLAFVYGGLAAGRIGPALIPAGFAFLFHLGREILKDAEDVAGDRAAGARTLATQVGIATALKWAGFVFVLLILATPLPFVMGGYSLAYLIIVILGVDVSLVWVIVSSLRNQGPVNLGRLSFLLKLDMWVGLAAIMMGVWA